MPSANLTSPSYDKLFFAFENAVACIPLVMVPFGFMVRQSWVDNRFYTNDVLFGSIVITYIIASIAWFWYVASSSRTKSIDVSFLIIFHILTLAFVLGVSGFLSAFLAVWIILLVSAHIRFGMAGFLVSFASLMTAGALSIVMGSGLSASEQLEMLPGILVIGAISLIIARLRATTVSEKNALHKTREQEAYQRERLLALVNSMGDAIVATDKNGAIKVYNSTFLNLLDTNTDMAGKNIDEVLKLTDRANAPILLIKEAHSRRKVFSRTDLSYTFADKETMRLYINVAPVQPNYRSQTESGFIFIMRDITKEKTLEEERDEFISVVSHELRTPVAIAEGGLSNIILLQARGAAPEVLKSAAVAAHDQVLYLSKLINDLSALSRAERGLGAETEIVDLVELLHGIYAKYAPQAEAKQLQLNLDIRGHELPKLVSSRLYLEEIIQNLVTNSLKYTRQGSITIRARRTKEAVSVEVKDTGIGIGKADQKHIFKKFYRSEDYRTRESSGTGLGLYVCQKLAEKIGLKIDFESRLNHGSTFILTITPSHFATGGAAAVSRPDSTHSAPST